MAGVLAGRGTEGGHGATTMVRREGDHGVEDGLGGGRQGGEASREVRPKVVRLRPRPNNPMKVFHHGPNTSSDHSLTFRTVSTARCQHLSSSDVAAAPMHWWEEEGDYEGQGKQRHWLPRHMKTASVLGASTSSSE